MSGRQVPKPYMGVAFPKTDFSPGIYEALPASSPFPPPGLFSKATY